MSTGNLSYSPTFNTYAASFNTLSRVGRHFPDPFMDFASVIMPRTILDVLRWAEFIYLTNGTYRMASQRVVRYFLTKIEVSDVGEEEKTRYEHFLNDDIGIVEFMAQLGDDFMCYGNSFVSIYVPFIRNIKCKKCGTEKPVGQAKYEFKNYKFYSACKCGYKGEFEHIDRRVADPSKVKLIRWSPHELRLMRHPISNKVDYWWDIPQRFKLPITQGIPFYIETTPWEVIEAIRDSRMFRFNDNALFHLREETLAGVSAQGWGISRVLSNFKQAYYIQIIKRYNEALALDYIIPFRVITPQAGNSSAADPVLHTNLGSFGGRVLNMIQQHRRDPATWHFLPFPIDYKALGGEGKNLTAPELLDQGHDELLNAIGIPHEMYRGTMTAQAAPTALRLFQQTWTHLPAGFNRFLNWVIESMSIQFHWERARAKLQPVTMADDLDRRNLMLQLMAGNMVSKELAFRTFGADVREELQRILNEQRMEQEMVQKFQEEQAQKQQMDAYMRSPGMPSAMSSMQPQMGQMGQMGPPMQGPPQMGAPPQPGGQMAMQSPQQGGITPDQKMMEAEGMAQQLLVMPDLQRKQQLTQIRRSDATMHALVLAKLDQLRQSAASQGQQMVIQQAAGQVQ